MEQNFYGQLRNDIVNLRLRPGTVISIKDLCDAYDIGRSPAREALIRLEQEGLIVFLPQRGTMISKISLKRVSDERFLRRSLEEQVMEEFLEGFSPAVLPELKACIEKQKVCYEAEDFRGFMDLDDEFHGIFYREAGRDFCRQIVESQSGHYRRIRLLSATDAGINHKVIQEHEELTAALEQKDFLRAREIFAHHLGKLREQEGYLISHFPDLFEDAGESDEKRSSAILQSDFLTQVSGTV